MGEWIHFLEESLTTPVSLVIVGAGFFGLLIGWLVGRPVATKKEVEKPDVDATQELQWRHEKLILVERQEVERGLRVERYLTELSASHGGTETDVRSRLFRLGESIRLMRGRAGADVSRLSLVSDRLNQLKEQGAPRPEAVDACLEMAGTQVDRLKGVREDLRSVSSLVYDLESELVEKQVRLLEIKDDLISRLEQIREVAAELNASWSVLTDESDRGIRDILAAGQEAEFEPLRQILLVDGAVTVSLEAAPAKPLSSQVDGLLRVLAGISDEDEEIVEAPVVSEPSEESAEGTQPDDGFRPAALVSEWSENGATLDEAEVEVSAPIPEEGPVLLFRSNDVGIWGKTVYRGANCRSRGLEEAPEWARWISIKRLDTGERVFVSFHTGGLTSGGNGDPAGFNASNELFYGANHLGVFSETCPNDVETRFTYGGWGFGHRVGDLSSGVESLQASGWAGKEISSDTVFEILLHAELPELGENDRLLESN